MSIYDRDWYTKTVPDRVDTRARPRPLHRPSPVQTRASSTCAAVPPSMWCRVMGALRSVVGTSSK